MNNSIDLSEARKYILSILPQAGGKITTPTGAKWDVFKFDILATNGILHEKIPDLI